MQWKVPYNARDAAGNEAVTVYREIVVKEYTLAEYLAEKAATLQRAAQVCVLVANTCRQTTRS